MDFKQAEKQTSTVQCLKKKKFRTPRNRSPNRPLSRAQMREIMLAVDNLRDSALLHLGFNCGMRVSEALSFNQDAVDWQQGQIKIWDEKKDQYRWVVPLRETLAKLKQWINQSHPAGNPIFNFSEKTCERIIQKWTLKVVGEKRSWHTIRHTYISICAENNINPAIVCMNTGDAPATILKYYTKLGIDYVRASIEQNPVYSETFDSDPNIENKSDWQKLASQNQKRTR